MKRRIKVIEIQYPSHLEEAVNMFIEEYNACNPRIVGYQTVSLGMSTSHSCLIEYND